MYQGDFSTRFGTMKYFVEGSGGEFAVLLQGWATKRELYDGIISLLAKRYTVVFPALHGFGDSGEPSEPMSVSDYAEAVNSLLEALGVKKAVFFCHSYGGRVFYKLNAMDGRFTEPARVILCDVAGIVPKKSLKKRIKLKVFRLGRRFLEWAPLKKLFPNLLDSLRSKSGSSDYSAASPVMRETLVLAVNEDLSHLVPFITAPTLIMWGRADDAVPLSDAYFIESRLSDGAVVVFEASAHFPFITESDRFFAVTRSFFEIHQ